MIELKKSEVWFITGSQHLYGKETLKQVDADSKKIADHLNKSAKIPCKVVFKPVLTTPDAITDIWRLSGDCGLFVRVELPSLEHLDPLIEDHISKIPGVQIKETCFVTREVKSKY